MSRRVTVIRTRLVVGDEVKGSFKSVVAPSNNITDTTNCNGSILKSRIVTENKVTSVEPLVSGSGPQLKTRLVGVSENTVKNNNILNERAFSQRTVIVPDPKLIKGDITISPYNLGVLLEPKATNSNTELEQENLSPKEECSNVEAEPKEIDENNTSREMSVSDIKSEISDIKSIIANHFGNDNVEYSKLDVDEVVGNVTDNEVKDMETKNVETVIDRESTAEEMDVFDSIDKRDSSSWTENETAFMDLYNNGMPSLEDMQAALNKVIAEREGIEEEDIDDEDDVPYEEEDDTEFNSHSKHKRNIIDEY